jgi:Family of unknown function (DUF6334)
MIDILAKIINKHNQLINVSLALFNGNPQFITAIELQFTSFSVTFRAVGDDDTLSVNIGTLELESDESLIDAGNSVPWSLCKGSYIVWDWQLTNQQGYKDGVRLEFIKPEEKFNAVVEFIVIASAIQMFSITRK